MNGDPRGRERDLFEHFGVETSPRAPQSTRAGTDTPSECRRCSTCGWYVKTDEARCSICGRSSADPERP